MHVVLVTQAIDVTLKNEKLTKHNKALQDKIIELNNSLEEYKADYLILTNKKLSQELREATASSKLHEDKCKTVENNLQKTLRVHETTVDDFNKEL